MILNCSKRTILAAVCSALMLGTAPQVFAAGGKSPVPVPAVDARELFDCNHGELAVRKARTRARELRRNLRFRCGV